MNSRLQSINARNGKIVSVVPITKGNFDRDNNHDSYYDDNGNLRMFGYGYGWGASFTHALLFIVEYPS